MKQLFFWVLLISFLPACSTPTKPEKTSASCYVRYMAQESQSMAEFILRRETPGGQSSQAVEVPEGVRYQGLQMSKVALQGITYRLEQGGGFALEHQFEWKSAQNQPQAVKMNMQPITSFSFEPATLSNKAPATLRWVGPALEKNESLVLIWEQRDGGPTVPMEIIGTAGQSQIDFPAAQMAKLPAGSWTLYLVRKKRVQEDVNGTNVLGAMEYYTRVDTLEVK